MDNCKGAVLASATPMDKAGHMHYMGKLGIFSRASFSSIMQKLGYRYDTKRFGRREVGTWVRNVSIQEAVEKIDNFFEELTNKGLMIKREVPMDNVDVSFHEIDLPQKALDELDKIQQLYDNPAVMLMAQRRFQEPYKVPFVHKMVEEELKEGRQVVIFANRVNDSEIGDKTAGRVDLASEGTIMKLIIELEDKGINTAKIFGNANVMEEKEKFQSGECQVAIVTPEKGGAGLSLDDDLGMAPRTMLVLTAPFSATNNVQMGGRINRLNTHSRSKIKYIFANTSVEHWNRSIISEKMQVLNAVVKGGTEKLKID
jgi:hypothetical protein